MIKKSVAVFAALLLTCSSLSANIIAYEDCYEAAFDAMEIIDDAGGSAEDVSFWGEMAYCECADNCYIE